jgi:anti-anti-sigma regulatory factor
MFEVKLDNSRKLLTIIYSQRVGPDETKHAEQELKTLLVQQEGGFCLLTDLSGLESMDVACVPYIRRVMDLLNKKGVERVVRVIPDPRKDIGLNIMSLFHYRRGIQIVTCETLEEAMKVLSQ